MKKNKQKRDRIIELCEKYRNLRGEKPVEKRKITVINIFKLHGSIKFPLRQIYYLL